MNKIYIILINLILLSVGYVFATDFDINITPGGQYAISGSEVSFDMVISNNTGVDVFFVQEFPMGIEYTNSSLVPLNNPSLIMGFETNPRWLVSSGQTLTLHVNAIVDVMSFDTLFVSGSIVDVNNMSVYTSSIAFIEGVSDVDIEKILTGNGPQFTGDNVIFSIVIKNIGSAIATGISLVDVWPDGVLVFSNQAIIDNLTVIPTIYNSLANNYLFDISDLLPGMSVSVEISGSMDNVFPAGQVFVNNSFVLVDSIQYSTGNDYSSATGSVVGISDMYVEVNQLSNNVSMLGDEIGYLISYGNIGTESATGIILQSVLPAELSFVSSSVALTSQVGNTLNWDLGYIAPGGVGQIFVTGSLLGGVPVGTLFVENVEISTIDVETNYINNVSFVTGIVDGVSVISMDLYANNITYPSFNTNTGLQIYAVSGDIVSLEILLTNDGNLLETGILYISGLDGFIDYLGPVSWVIDMAIGTTQTVILTGIVGPQNFVEFNPMVEFISNSMSYTGSISIDEPIDCGDGLITQTEVCDINGQIGDILLGQSCIEENGQCILMTEHIINTVCMKYSTDIGTGEQCMNVTVNYEPIVEQLMCDSLSSPYNVLITDDNNEGDMLFTCNTIDGVIANEIKIDCGNGDVGIGQGVSLFSYNCEYILDENGTNADNTYNVQCFVDGETSQECTDTLSVDAGFYGVCGNGILDDGEECDLGGNEDEEDEIGDYLDLEEEHITNRYDNGEYYCEDCKIRKYDTNEFVYQPPQCLGINTTISVMENELMPFWWRLWYRDNMKIGSDYDCDDIDSSEDHTIIDKDSMECTFVVYNGNDYLQANSDKVNKFTVDCFEKEDSMFFDYFEKEYNVDFDKMAGMYVRSVNSLLDGDQDTYGEYKLVLEKVEYKYCDPETKDWKDGRLYEGVCEVNFVLTRPYIMQISTFGLNPKATNASDFLEDFYDMRGNSLVDSTDINETLSVDQGDYSFDSDTIQQMSDFKSRYKPLSITVDNNFEVRDGKTVGMLFGNANVRKVPNRLIFFIEGNGELRLKQLTTYFPGDLYTIYVEGMDVVVEGSVMTNGMIITDNKILFEDELGDDGYCQEGGQIVKGIFVAQGGFGSTYKMMNQEDENRCQRGNLKVKGVLIGDDMEQLAKSKRSHLNIWFNSTNNSEDYMKNKRKNEIFNGAALLIEYNPDLWSNLSPGAESFMKTLEVYKK